MSFACLFFCKERKSISVRGRACLLCLVEVARGTMIRPAGRGMDGWSELVAKGHPPRRVHLKELVIPPEQGGRGPERSLGLAVGRACQTQSTEDSEQPVQRSAPTEPQGLGPLNCRLLLERAASHIAATSFIYL